MIKTEEELIAFLEKNFPKKSAEKWDFVGYSIFNKKKQKDKLKILIVLDVNELVCKEAINKKIDLIISFHPFCFANSWKDVYKYDLSKKAQVEQLKKNKINVYSLHTNFDNHKLGTKYWLMEKLGLESQIIKKYKHSIIIDYKKSFISLIEKIKDKTNTSLIYSNFDKINNKINKVYFYPGSGDVYEFIKHNENDNVDLFVTSDMKWNEQQLLNSLKIKFAIVSHKIEDIFIEVMNNLLKNNVDNKKIIIKTLYIDDFVKGY